MPSLQQIPPHQRLPQVARPKIVPQALQQVAFLRFQPVDCLPLIRHILDLVQANRNKPDSLQHPLQHNPPQLLALREAVRSEQLEHPRDHQHPRRRLLQHVVTNTSHPQA